MECLFILTTTGLNFVIRRISHEAKDGFNEAHCCQEAKVKKAYEVKLVFLVFSNMMF